MQSETTPTDTLPREPVWFEVAAVELPIVATAFVVQLPGDADGVLGRWSVVDTHPSVKPGDRGSPQKNLIYVFARPVSPDRAPAMQRNTVQAGQRLPPAPTTPARAPHVPTAQRRQQGPAAAPKSIVVQAAEAVNAVENAVGGLLETVAQGVVNSVMSRTAPSKPAPAAANPALDCACADPRPAVENSDAPAVPCLGCGGWIHQGQVETAEQPTA